MYPNKQTNIQTSINTDISFTILIDCIGLHGSLETYSNLPLKDRCVTLTEPQRFYANETGPGSHTLAHDTENV